MKFVCIACDRPMELAAAAPDGPAESLTARFRCPACGNEVAMLTNPWETEVVRSLGVRVGAGPGCPFAGTAATLGSEAAGPISEAVSSRPTDSAAEAAAGGSLSWTAGALARLERIPEFVRPMARQGIEHFARGRGRTLVTEEVLEEARSGIGI